MKYWKIFMMFVNSVKYCEICAILARQYFSDFTIYHNVSHVSQYCALYYTAPVCRLQVGLYVRRTLCCCCNSLHRGGKEPIKQ